MCGICYLVSEAFRSRMLREYLGLRPWQVTGAWVQLRKEDRHLPSKTRYLRKDIRDEKTSKKAARLLDDLKENRCTGI